jgi:hypothetical protein
MGVIVTDDAWPYPMLSVESLVSLVVLALARYIFVILHVLRGPHFYT